MIKLTKFSLHQVLFDGSAGVAAMTGLLEDFIKLRLRQRSDTNIWPEILIQDQEL